MRDQHREAPKRGAATPTSPVARSQTNFCATPAPSFLFSLSLSSNCATSQKLCRNRYIRTLETLVHSRAHSQFFTNVFAVSRSLNTVVSLFRWSSQARNMFVPLRFPIARTAWSRTSVAISSRMRTSFLLFIVFFLVSMLCATRECHGNRFSVAEYMQDDATEHCTV